MSGLLLSIESSGVNSGKYELDLDSTASVTFNTLGITNGLTCTGLVMSSGTTSFTANSSGVSLTGPNALTIAGNIKTGSLTCDGNAVINGTLTGTAITSLSGSGFNSSNFIVGSGIQQELIAGNMK